MARAFIVVVLLAALIPSPATAASPATGVFTILGDVNPPAQSTVALAPLGLFLSSLHDPLALDAFVLTAPEVEIWSYWSRNVETVGPETPPPIPHYASVPAESGRERLTLHNVTLSVNGELQKGYVAVDTSPADASLHLVTGPGATIASTNHSVWSHSTGTGATGREDMQHRRAVEAPHVAVTSPGKVAFQGASEWKLYGVPLRADSAEGVRDFRTGQFDESDGNVRTTMYRWVVLVAKEATFSAASWQPWQLGGPTAGLQWNGEARFSTVDGEISSDGVSRQVQPGKLRLAGSFEGTLVPVSAEGTMHTRLKVSGQLEQASAVNGNVLHVGTPPSRAGALLLPALALAVVAAGAGGMYYWHRRISHAVPAPITPPPVTPSVAAEYYVGLAEEAIQAEDHAKALHWIQLAREAVPTSADVATTMAFILGELGQDEEALEAYAEASRLDPSDGEADVNAARLALRVGKPVEAVEELVVRALERSPEFVLDVEEDVEFQALALRPAFQDALERAWWRWSGEPRSSR